MSPAIGMLGASGLVGTEVCLYLDAWPGVEIVPICRSSRSAELLQRSGLRCRIGDVSDPGAAAQLLDGLDLVADFTRPQGLACECFAAVDRIVTHSIAHAPAGARFVYASSVLAFGVHPLQHRRIERRRFARTVYGMTKRRGEGLALRRGRERGLEVYILRIGEVYGEIQGGRRDLLQRVRSGRVRVPDGPSPSVFAYSIAEALAHIAEGREQPGCYTLVSEPAWSHRELLEYVLREAGVDAQVESHPVAAAGRSQRLRAAVASARELATGHLLARWPWLEARVTALMQRRAGGSAGDASAPTRPGGAAPASPDVAFPLPYVGVVPGERLRSSTDTRDSTSGMHAAVRQLRARLDAAGAQP